MSEIVRIGASVAVAKDQTPLGVASATLVTVDEEGNELAREEVVQPPGLVLHVVHFDDLDDGRRLTTAGRGEISLSIPRSYTLEDLRAEARELFFEDEYRETCKELSDDAPWTDVSSQLRQNGIVAGEAALRALPFVVEFAGSATR